MSEPFPPSPRPLSGAGDRTREIGWNGIRLTLPTLWNPLVVGKCYLLMGEAGEPAFEIRWQTSQGENSRAASLQNLARRLNRSKHMKIVATPMPPAWIGIGEGWQAEAFQWCDDRGQGLGLLLACRHCGGTALARFFSRTGLRQEPSPLSLLKSIRDHSDDGDRLWALYDIRATLPANLSLERFRFDSGRFELTFTGRGFTLRLLRWAPADVLLLAQGLRGFIESARLFPLNRASGLVPTADEMAEWRGPVDGAWTVRVKRRLGLRPSERWARCWHQPLQNRILGVVAEGGRLPPFPIFEAICRGYETL